MAKEGKRGPLRTRCMEEGHIFPSHRQQSLGARREKTG